MSSCLNPVSLPPMLALMVEDADLSLPVILKVFDKLKTKEEVDKFRRLIRMDVEFHKAHKKINGVKSRGCGCEYCLALNRYSTKTLEAHRLRKKIDSSYYGPIYCNIENIRKLNVIEEEAKKNREQKNFLKMKTALNSLS